MEILEPFWLTDSDYRVLDRSESARGFEKADAPDRSYLWDVMLVSEDIRHDLKAHLFNFKESRVSTFEYIVCFCDLGKGQIFYLTGIPLATRSGKYHLFVLKEFDVASYLKEIVLKNLHIFKMSDVLFAVFNNCYENIYYNVDDSYLEEAKKFLRSFSFSEPSEKFSFVDTIEIGDRYVNIRVHPISIGCAKGVKLKLGYVVIFHDITGERQLFVELSHKEKIIDSLISTPDNIFILAKGNRIVSFNQYVVNVLGYSEDELKKKAPWDIVLASDRDLVVNYMLMAMEGELRNPVIRELRLEKKKGGFIWVRMYIDCIFALGSYCTLIFAHDITKYKTLEEELKKASTLDELTGVYNRRALWDFMSIFTKHSKRYKEPLSLMIIDIDNFKYINDNYGHLFGDKVLKEFTKIATNCIRESDVFARYGGDEFIILMPKAGIVEARIIAERIREELRKTPLVGTVSVTVSIGITEYIEGEEVEFFLKRADEALYEAKITGKNRVAAR